MALIDSLVSYWSLDETSGTRVDAHASNDLTDNNTVLSATGIQSNAADFETSNSEYLSITDAAQSGLGLTTDFSFSLWVKAESLSVERGLISKWGALATNRSFYLVMRDTNKIVVAYNSDNTASTGADCTTDNAVITSTSTWYHIVAMMDISASTGSIYINGSLVATTSSGTGTVIETGAGSFRIGDVEANNLYWDGLIDEVGVWSRLLTAEEVSQLYDDGFGNPYPFHLPADGTDVAGAPTESVAMRFQPTVTDVAGAPTEMVRAKYGYSNTDKSSAPSFVNNDKS